MIVHIRYFAVLRERMGLESESLEFDGRDDVRAEDVFTACLKGHFEDPDKLKPHLRVAINQDFASFDAIVKDGDEIAFIPPVSGGSSPVSASEDLASDDRRFRMTMEPIETSRVRDLVARPFAGALTVFEGRVRDHTGDRKVAYLEYEAYPEMALKKLIETASAAEEKWADTSVAIHHRYGKLDIGEIAVAIAVSSPHRAEAFDACRWVIDRLKENVPIWKKEVGPGGESWVGWGP